VTKIHGNKRYNRYDLTGDFGIGYTSKGEEFYFDLEDYDKISYHCWYIETGGRLVARNGNHVTQLKFHRLVMGVTDPKIEVDHIDHNQVNNRKYNLRTCSHNDNMKNQKKQKNNTSGYAGVYFIKDAQKFLALIEHDGIVTRLGWFADKESALIARLKAEKLYYGEFAPSKDLFDKFNI
jgi:hypothetical protein